MNKRLKIAIFVIAAILLTGMMLIQYVQPKSSYEEVAIEDEKLNEEIDELAQDYLKEYFDITLSENQEWEKRLVLNRGKDKSSPNILAYSAENKEKDLEEGNIDFYGVIIEEESKRLRGIIYQYVSNAPIMELTDEEVQKRSEDFLISKGLVPTDTKFSLGTIQSDEQTPGLRMLTLTAGEDTYAISYSLQWDNVMYFECIPGV